MGSDAAQQQLQLLCRCLRLYLWFHRVFDFLFPREVSAVLALALSSAATTAAAT